MASCLLDHELPLGWRHHDPRPCGSVGESDQSAVFNNLDVGRSAASHLVPALLVVLVLIFLGLLFRRIEEIQLGIVELLARVLVGGQVPDQCGDIISLIFHLILGEPLGQGLDGQAVVRDGILEETLHVLQEVNPAVGEIWLLLHLGASSRHVVPGEDSLLLPFLHHLGLPLAGEIFPECLVSSGLGSPR